MEITKKLMKGLREPKKFVTFMLRNFGAFIPDKQYLKLLYRVQMGCKLNLDDPKTFNEKLQWLKLYGYRSEYTVMVDKVHAKEYAAKIIGSQYIIPTLGVWDSPDDIDFDSLPDKFVLKCNHNSGGVIICQNKSELDIPRVKRKLRNGLKEDYYKLYRERPYKDVKRKILAELLIDDVSGEGLTDYKLMCFGGKVYCTFVCSERFCSDGVKITAYDRDWKRMTIERLAHPTSKHDIPKPKLYEKMIVLAEMLALDTPFIRIDFYEVGEKLYFGEMTLYPATGMERFKQDEWDVHLGNLLVLPSFDS